MRNNFRRARKPEEKEKRRVLLLSVARSMLARDPDLNGLSLSRLAENSMMAKSNIYRYFETREALLLAILWEEWGEWFLAVKKQLGSSKGRLGLHDLVREIARTLANRRILCSLTAALPSVVERNLSELSIRDFKIASLEALNEFGVFLESSCPELNAKTYARLIYDAACLIAGIYPHANPSKTVVKVIRSPELEFFRHDFLTDLERIMIALANEAKREIK